MTMIVEVVSRQKPTTEQGLHRIHLTSNTNTDWFTIFVPLDNRGYVCLGLAGVPQPYLLKAEWNCVRCYGEVKAAARNSLVEPSLVYLVFFAELPVCPSEKAANLGTTPMVLGQVVLIWETYEAKGKNYPFTVRSVQKL
jgi:hypothetical protein